MLVMHIVRMTMRVMRAMIMTVFSLVIMRKAVSVGMAVAMIMPMSMIVVMGLVGRFTSLSVAMLVLMQADAITSFYGNADFTPTFSIVHSL